MSSVRIVNADCVNALIAERELYIGGDLPVAAFCDPPFGIGQKYNGFSDKWKSESDFESFCNVWIGSVVASVNGIVMLHGPDKLADIYITAARRLGLERIAWVNWHYNFGQCSRRNWIDARCHCLVYRNVKEHTWNPEPVLVDSERKRMGDKRIHEYANGGRRVPGTVWGIKSDGDNWGRVQGNNKERWRSHPNQLPLVYVGRLLKAYTNPGDLVLDPFCGSGTVPLACTALGRRCLAFDVSKESVESATARVSDESQVELAIDRLCV